VRRILFRSFPLEKKNPSPHKTRRKGRNLVIQTATKGKASSLARQGLGLNSLRPTENETTWAVGGPSYGPPREASSLARQGLIGSIRLGPRRMEPRGPWAAHRVPAGLCDEEPTRNFRQLPFPPPDRIGRRVPSSPRPPPSELTVDRASPSRRAPSQAMHLDGQVRSGQSHPLPRGRAPLPLLSDGPFRRSSVSADFHPQRSRVRMRSFHRPFVSTC